MIEPKRSWNFRQSVGNWKWIGTNASKDNLIATTILRKGATGYQRGMIDAPS
jgi:hypothetical protein